MKCFYVDGAELKTLVREGVVTVEKRESGVNVGDTVQVIASASMGQAKAIVEDIYGESVMSFREFRIRLQED